jgi:hypothetical protein
MIYIVYRDLNGVSVVLTPYKTVQAARAAYARSRGVTVLDCFEVRYE